MGTIVALSAGALVVGYVAGYLLRRRGATSTEQPEYNATSSETGQPVYFAADDVEALGRVITSEANRYTLAERTAIAWTVRNRAQKRKQSIVRLVCSPCGPQGPGRPFASSRAATAENVALARAVLAAPQSDDPTGGATAFFEPAVQDRLVLTNRRLIAQGQPPKYRGYRRMADEVRAEWQRGGQRQLATVGAFELWT
jgi:hypothetical protein